MCDLSRDVVQINKSNRDLQSIGRSHGPLLNCIRVYKIQVSEYSESLFRFWDWTFMDLGQDLTLCNEFFDFGNNLQI